jgi:hypothetical protein
VTATAAADLADALNPADLSSLLDLGNFFSF